MSKVLPRNWTPKDDKDLHELIKTKTWAEIGAYFGCSAEAARKRAVKLRLRKTIVSKSRSGDLRIFRYAASNGDGAAADHFNISKSEVTAARKRHLKRRDAIARAMTPKRIEKLRLLCFRQANTSGMAHLAEDFAGWAIDQILDGSKQEIWQLLGNFRSYWKEQNTIPLAEDYTPGELCHVPIAPERSACSDVFWIADKLNLSMVERAAFLLHYRDDKDEIEIAKYLGIGEPAVKRQLAIIQSIITSDRKTMEFIKELYE